MHSVDPQLMSEIEALVAAAPAPITILFLDLLKRQGEHNAAVWGLTKLRDKTSENLLERAQWIPEKDEVVGYKLESGEVGTIVTSEHKEYAKLGKLTPEMFPTWFQAAQIAMETGGVPVILDQECGDTLCPIGPDHKIVAVGDILCDA